MPSVVCQRLFMKSAWGWPDPSLEWNVSTVVSSCLAVYVDLVIQLEDYNAMVLSKLNSCLNAHVLVG